MTTEPVRGGAAAPGCGAGRAAARAGDLAGQAPPAGGPGAFCGAKLAVLIGAKVLVLRRDAHPGLRWPGMWDLPGGGRERGESPEDCARRELAEELGLTLPPGAVFWRRRYPAMDGGPGEGWFLAARPGALDPARLRLGDEGMGWTLMAVPVFLTHPEVIPALAQRLGDCLAASGSARAKG